MTNLSIHNSKSSCFPSIAILITCHNRRDTTLTCLSNLTQQTLSSTVYLVDDGSTDDTSLAVQSQYPDVNILSGSGSLFWGG